ncbi:hypothetical protein F2Q69_00007747 [Brassica cretica]|uniref:Uncharacterized protein n=1 Tax=Brassica cretica TaxID=69181 RepID=A0A8S9PAT2_BRACR|nr:hypothetical protein F2Q69_00007747 [Brassica cretica]
MRSYLEPGGHGGTQGFSFRSLDRVWDPEVVREPGCSLLDLGIMTGARRRYGNLEIL